MADFDETNFVLIDYNYIFRNIIAKNKFGTHSQFSQYYSDNLANFIIILRNSLGF